uniref:Uncharacterized protein n=1 Tax=Anguilla anguilla TaxID=7936 RepID=A0A0E9VYX0_ANGAN
MLQDWLAISLRRLFKSPHHRCQTPVLSAAFGSFQHISDYLKPLIG